MMRLGTRIRCNSTSSSIIIIRNISSRGNRNVPTLLFVQSLQQPQPSRHIPMWNGKPISFHFNDLQHLPSSSLSLHNQQYRHYGNGISSSSSPSSSTPSSSSLQSLDDVTENKNRHHDNNNNDDPLIVVLDLDQCLIHSELTDAEVSVHQLQQNRMKDSHSQSQLSFDSFRIVLHNEYHYQVFIRPGCIEFLAQVTQLYPTYIYTAAISAYANPILDHLSYTVRTKLVQQQLQQQQNPLDISTTIANTKKCIFQGRYYREHCIYDDKMKRFYKDLTQLHRHNDCNRTISSQTHKMVLIDNSPFSLFKNPHNGILVDDFEGPFAPISSPIPSTTTTNTTPSTTSTNIHSDQHHHNNNNNNKNTILDPTFTNVLQLLQELSMLPDVRPRIAADQKLQQLLLQALQPPKP